MTSMLTVLNQFALFDVTQANPPGGLLGKVKLDCNVKKTKKKTPSGILNLCLSRVFGLGEN